MTEEYINTAIAGYHGYTDINRGFGWVKTSEDIVLAKVPDYCNDLNAMHIVESNMAPEDKAKYASYLSQTLTSSSKKAWWDLDENQAFKVVNATAKEKAEAYLKTLDKWEEHPQIN